MVKKSKLLLALDAHKGRDYEAEKKKKQVKSAEKRKRQKIEKAAADNEENENDSSSEEAAADQIEQSKPKKVKIAVSETTIVPVPAVQDEEGDSDSQAGSDEEAEGASRQNGTTIPQPDLNAEASASEAEQESDVPLSDLEDEDMEDTIPHQRLTINNGPALLASKKRVTIAKSKMPFHYHNSLISTLPPSSEVIPDPNDDLTRELEFYRIARDGVVSARIKFKQEKVPFTRPTDYFAEMVKSEEHMGKVKKKMYDEAAGKKASEEAKKLRDAKKFGKQVQIAKEQERAKEKRTTLEQIKELKKRRKDQPSTSTREPEGEDMFQEIAVERGNGSKKRSLSSYSSRGGGAGGENSKRQKRDAKYGFGGKKRFSKSGDAMSSADLSSFSSRGMKGKGGRGGGAAGGAGRKKPMTTKRLGKSKRVAARS